MATLNASIRHLSVRSSGSSSTSSPLFPDSSRRGILRPTASAAIHASCFAHSPSKGLHARSHAAPTPRSPSGFIGMSHMNRGSRTVLAAASPWDEMDNQFASMDRQFASVDRQFADMDRQFAQMERQMDRDFADIFGRTSSALEQQRREVQQLEEAVRQQIRTVQPDVQIQRLEQRGVGSYSYYQSIQITSGGYQMPTPAASAAPLHPLVLVGALLAAAHVAVAATFVRNFDLTTYSPRWRWTLTLLWPVLAIFNRPFRQQLLSALQGKRAAVTKSGETAPEAS